MEEIPEILLATADQALREQVQVALAAGEPAMTLRLARGEAEARASMAERPPTMTLVADPLTDGDAQALLPGPHVLAEWPTVLLLPREDPARIAAALTAGAFDCLVCDDSVSVGLTRILGRLLRQWRLELDRRRLLAWLKESEKQAMVGQLAGGIAHDVNNQLAVIMGFADMLLLKLEKDDPLRRYAQQIRQASRHTRALMQQLLAYARKGNYRSVAVNVRQLLEAAVSWLTSAGGVPIAVQREFAAEEMTVTGDPDQLYEVFSQLVRNARDAMPEGGKVILRCRRVTLPKPVAARLHDQPSLAGDVVEVTVCDSGPGIPAAVMPHLFEPFFTTRPQGQGVGLGLAAASGIVASHGGTIKAANGELGGACFRVLLPAARKTDFGETTTVSEHRPVRPARLLVIDDDDAVRDMVTEILAVLGHEAIPAASGEEGIQLYRDSADRFDLVLLDMMMPGMDGTATFDALRLLDPAAKVILCSGYASSEEVKALLARGALDVVAKPFSMNALGQTIGRHRGQ